MRGRKPTPTNLKLLKGETRPSRINKNEPKPKPLAPAAAAWLSADARKLRKGLAPKLEALGILTEADGASFDLMLTHYSLASEAARTLKKEGSIIEDSKGYPAKHPAVQILRDHSAAFLRYAAEFGLTPSSRARLNLVTPEEEIDELEEFLRQGQELRNRKPLA